MSENKMDFAKVLAILAQPREKPEPLKNVERLRIEIPYITKAEKIDIRAVRVVMPTGAAKPLPLVFVPHYEMGEDSLELRDYLAEGWAVACPSEFNDTYNGTLTDDDLVFNNAALYTLRRRPEFDSNKMFLVGGSAGAYTTLMLNGLQLGLCASVANGPIANVYFSFQHYFTLANALNQQALIKLMAEEQPEPDSEPKDRSQINLLAKLSKLPIPFIAALSGLFSPNRENFPDKTDTEKWEQLSPIGLTDCFCSPIMINHSTSDVLVPVDQLSRKFTYRIAGASLPDDFDMHLPESFPGMLNMTLEERLPASKTSVVRIPVPEGAVSESALPYDPAKQFNLNIYDDGPAEGYGTHSSRMDVGRRLDVPYLREMAAKGAAATCLLTPDMLKRLLNRYLGDSISLPAHVGVDDSVYGSPEVYREEIREELTAWAEIHGKAALWQVFEQLMERDPDDSLRETLQSIIK